MCSSILVQSLATPRELDLVEERTCPLESVTSTLKVSESSCKTVSKAFLRLIVSGITKTTPSGSVDVKSNCGIQIYHWLVRMVVAFRQGVSCDRFFGRTHAPRTSRLMCARTCVHTPNLRWSHFAPAPALLVNFSAVFNLFSAIFQHF